MFKQRSSKCKFLKRKTGEHIHELERNEKIRQITSTAFVNNGQTLHDIGEDNNESALSDHSRTNLNTTTSGNSNQSQHIPLVSLDTQNCVQQCNNDSESENMYTPSDNDSESENMYTPSDNESELDDEHTSDRELQDEEGWGEVVDNVDSESGDDQEDKENDELHNLDRENANDSASTGALGNDLRTWALEYHIKQNALSKLLKILKPHHTELPSDGRTLLKTCRTTNVLPFGNDHSTKLSYFGIETGLHKFDLKKLCSDKIVLLKVNIDGLQISNSTSAQFWPILCQIVCEEKYTTPFAALVYYGTSKPNSLHEFLGQFIREARALSETGFNHQGEIFRVKIHCLICDSPARAFIKAVKGHTGYYGCEKCTQMGKSILNRLIFPESEACLRTDESFANQTQEEHHIGVSPLLDLQVGLVSQVPLDSMHLVYIGVVKKVILCFIRNGPRPVKIGVHQISRISEILVDLRRNIPREFSRKPRGLKYIDRWKATELRQFCLYTSPVVLRNILPEAQYKHFLVLHVAISILSNPGLSSDERYISYAEGLLRLFIQNMATIYGAHTIVYNVHNLTHLANDVRKFGCLDSFSCFPFESFLGQLKRQLRTPNRSLEQLSKRLSEQQNIRKDVSSLPVVTLRGLHRRGPCMGLVGEQFRDVTFNGSAISTKVEGDSYVNLQCGKIGRVLNVIKTSGADPNPENVILILEEVPQEGDLYDYPCNSRFIGILKIRRIQPDSPLFSAKLKTVHKKCIVSEANNVAIILNHGIY